MKEHREKAETKRNVQQRAECYKLANNFLSGIYAQAGVKLVTSNSFPDSLSNFIRTDYLNEMIGKASTKYNELCKGETALMGVFEEDVMNPVKGMATNAKKEHERKKKKLEARCIDQSASTRKVHILYKHEYLQFSNFSKYLGKHFDGSVEEYLRVRDEQVQEVAGIGVDI